MAGDAGRCRAEGSGVSAGPHVGEKGQSSAVNAGSSIEKVGKAVTFLSSEYKAEKQNPAFAAGRCGLRALQKMLLSNHGSQLHGAGLVGGGDGI